MHQLKLVNVPACFKVPICKMSGQYRFLTHGLPLWGSQHFDLNGKHTRDVPPEISPEIAALRKHYGRAPFFLGWHEIRQLLYDFVPKHIVEFDKQASVFCLAASNAILQVNCSNHIVMLFAWHALAPPHVEPASFNIHLTCCVACTIFTGCETHV